MVTDPETHVVKPNKHTPNSPLPILVYRDCLPLPLSEDKTTDFLESHAWVKKGTWGHIGQRHFHPNTHECYGIFQGSSILLLGQGHNDTDGGAQIEVNAGDVIVLPAGIAHCSVQSSLDYRYIGVYPEGAPHWRSELGKTPVTPEVLTETKAVGMPKQDPVYGQDGPLIRLWTEEIRS